MPHKGRELAHVERFRAICGFRFSVFESDRERPDFVIRDAENRLLGLEHTEFYWKPPVGTPEKQRVQKQQDEIVAQARSHFRQQGGPPLYVSVAFRSDTEVFTRVERQALAARLSKTVAENGWRPAFDGGCDSFEPWRTLPEVVGYTVSPSFNGEDELWDSASGDYVALVGEAEVSESIERKSFLATDYDTTLEAHWLLIVNDLGTGGQPCELRKQALRSTYRSNFERVFWLEYPFGPAHELRLGEPASESCGPASTTTA